MQSGQPTTKKNKNLHRRTQSSTVYDMARLLNVPSSDRQEILQDMVNTYNIINSERTQKAVEASNAIVAEKHVIVEDIEEVPKSSGYIVPKYPKNDSNPLSIIKRRNLSYSEGANTNLPQKQPQRKIDPEMLGSIIGLNVIYERHHSIESSDFKSDKLSVSSKETHTRTNSLGEGLQFSARNYNGKRTHAPNEIETKCSPRVSSSNGVTPSPKSGGLLQKSKLVAPQPEIKETAVKSKLNINKKISPEEAKNFLKLLNKQRQSPSLNSSKTSEHPGTPVCESMNQITPSKIISEEDTRVASKTMKEKKGENGRTSPKVFVFDEVARNSGSKHQTEISVDGAISNNRTPKSSKNNQMQERSEVSELLSVLKSLQNEVTAVRNNQKEIIKQIGYVTEVVTSLQKENAHWRQVLFLLIEFGGECLSCL